MKRIFYFLIIILASWAEVAAQMVTVTVDVIADKHSISPFIYGRNNMLSSDPQKPLTQADWQFLRDAGVRIVRENGGNNSTKYNWRKKISSHPDWYNNVYSSDWDFEVSSMQEKMPELCGIWAFQLIGRAASTNLHNFNDWGYNQSKWWSGVNQNLAGGGQINTAGGSKALVNGNPELYTMEWNADSTTGILPHWLNNLNIEKKRIMYWNMDNEIEIWNGTHDDVMPVQIAAEDFIQRYVAVAKKARALFPEIKLMGPVPANEWQWYAYDGKKIAYQGKEYVWLEYFIKRISEEQSSSGLRLLDVLDIHFYPEESRAEDIVQGHRVYFDKNYNYPGANGVKISGSGGWDNTITKEYIFERCKDWLKLYLGENHGVGLAVTETGIKVVNPSVTAVWYASMLGEFAKQSVEVFTPWHWDKGMWETLHLFSRYGKENYVRGTSSSETYISAYPTLSSNNDSLTLFLVNRYVDRAQEVTIQLSNFFVHDGNYSSLRLENLPADETFKSHTNNALKSGSVTAANNRLTVTLPKMSVTAVMLKGSTNSVSKPKTNKSKVSIFPNPAGDIVSVNMMVGSESTIHVQVCDMQGKVLREVFNEKHGAGDLRFDIETGSMVSGVYLLRISSGKEVIQKKLVVQ